MSIIQAPTSCPSCSSALEWSNHLLYCRNAVCPAKVSKSVEHFAKTMKIKGLGPSAISKLQLENIEEIYLLSEEDIAKALSSEKLAEKLYAEIQNSKNAPGNSVLPAFGIPLIGKTLTEKLSTVVNSILDINEDSCVEAGLGPKATENLMNWLISAHDEGLFNSLPLNYKFLNSKKPQQLGVVCISGKLKSFKNKAEATTALESAGFTVKSSLTKDVTILVNESGIESAKTQKARNSGVTIVTNLFEFLGDF